MATVVTSWSPKGGAEYGQHFLRTFAEFWPPSDRLVIYTEGQRIFHGRPVVRDLRSVKPCADFLVRHAAHPETWGRAPVAGWRKKDVEEGYSYRHDAYKFARKVFAIKHAADDAIRNGEKLLAWIDGDVVFTREVPARLLADLIRKDDVAYLGREGTHSECGFLIFRLPEAMPLIERWWAFYNTDAFLMASEWHDSFLFDRAREGCADVRQRNLTPGGWGAVWSRSPLATFSDHRKGRRKEEAPPK